MCSGRTLLRLAIAAALVVLAARALLPAAGRFLVEADAPAKADAMYVLAGSYPDRILEAVALYKEGWAPRIVICREPDTAGFRRIAELGVDIPRPYEINRMVAERLGVPPSAVAVLDRAGDSTYAEAEAVIADAMAHRYGTIVIVTSKYHTRRAGEIYRLLAGDRVRVIIRPARDDDFQTERWWRDRISTRRLIIEYQKLLNFVLVDRWGLSPVATPSIQP